MMLLIDGYNLLHVTGIFGRGVGPGSLERSRRGLLNFLAASIPPEELRHTVIVFDAESAPSGLPRTVDHGGMMVRYATEYEDADSLIEELIAKHSAPRSLTVVSSDHRLHRAARRRKAKPVDSDVWYAELIRQRREQSHFKPPGAAKEQEIPTKDEVKFWLEEFAEQEPERKNETRDEFENPFPPGYGEDLLE